MKKILTIISIACVAAVSLQAGTARKDTLRILAIGNSFSTNAVEQNLHEIAEADGKCAIIGNMFIGGCSLKRHFKNSATGNRDYSYRKIDTTGVLVDHPGVTLEEALADENWDVVTFQESSPISGFYTTHEPYLTGLIAFVAQRVTPGTELYWHQTWAYAKDSGHPDFPKYDRDQDKMYSHIMAASRQACDEHNLKIIPCGTAVQNLRRTYIGDSATVDDGFHLNAKGKYLAACTWYQTLFGRSVVGNSYKPGNISDSERLTIQKCAAAAVSRPYSTRKITK